MKMKSYILIGVLMVMSALTAGAQVDKRDVRRGNRDYKKENYKEAEIEYRKGIVKDSLSVAANYNLAAWGWQ
jgi:Ca-activated chloride channel family protein